MQLTWRENYAKASKILSLYDDRDLEWHPHMALDSLIATRVLFRGMAEGWFTGRKLGQYFNETEDDPLNARQIINGNDDDELIAGYHEEFLDALRLARIPDDRRHRDGRRGAQPLVAERPHLRLPSTASRYWRRARERQR